MHISYYSAQPISDIEAKKPLLALLLALPIANTQYIKNKINRVLLPFYIKKGSLFVTKAYRPNTHFKATNCILILLHTQGLIVC